MAKWEYLTFARVAGAWTDDKFDGRTPQQKLSDFGQEGWELVSVLYDSAGYHFYLKRPMAGRRKGPTEKSKATTKASRKKS
jgi:hypothetical protein